MPETVAKSKKVWYNTEKRSHDKTSDHGEKMKKRLSIDTVPAFKSCSWIQRSGTFTFRPSEENGRLVLLMCFGGRAETDTYEPLTEEKYLIADDELSIVFDVDPDEDENGILGIGFDGVFSTEKSIESLAEHGIFNRKPIAAYVNRLREIKEKSDDGQAVSLLEQEALFCNILNKIRNSVYLPRDKNLAMEIMNELVAGVNGKTSISGLARKYNYSRNYVIEVFKAEYGTTPYQHLMNMRVSAAMDLMRTTGDSLGTIAEKSGFGDLTTFFRAFMKVNGVPPSVWRREQMKKKKTSVTLPDGKTDNEENGVGEK